MILPSSNNILSLDSWQKRKELAQAFKEQGNKAYTSGKLETAVDLYSKGLAAEQLAVFYSNRAACECHTNSSGKERKIDSGPEKERFEA